MTRTSGSILAVTPELELLSCALEYAVSLLIAAWVLEWRRFRKSLAYILHDRRPLPSRVCVASANFDNIARLRLTATHCSLKLLTGTGNCSDVNIGENLEPGTVQSRTGSSVYHPQRTYRHQSR